MVFFEKNGQLFDEFRLPYGKEEFELQQIVWSSVADCVAILGIEHAKDKSQVQSQDQLQNKSTDNQQRQVILIYSMRNFHWYCQQKLVFTTATVDGKQPIRKLMNQVQSTNEFQPLALLALFDDGRIGEFVYANAVCCTSSGDCAVIDGRSLLLTPFQHSAVPPPMYGYSLRFHAEINEVCFSQPTGAYLLVQLADQTLHLIERSQSKQIKLGSNLQLAFQSISFKQPNLPPIYSSGSQTFSVAQLLEWVNKGAAELDAARQDAARQEAADQKTAKSINQIDPVNKSNQPGDEIRLYQLHLTDKKVCYALCSSPENNNQLIGVDLEHAKTNTANQSMQLICLNSSATNQFLVSVDSDGFVWKFSLSTSLESTGALESNASHLTPFQVKNESNQQLKLGGAIESIVRLAAVGESHVVALYTNYQLHINGRSRGAGCNSFLAHDFDLLLYTTNDHQLRSIWLGGKLNSSFEHKHRMVERGSRLITSCSSDCKVVLQMPRGNLELITPRLLLLDRIKLLLNTLQYRSAFMLMKKHRINLNLIVDFDLECFLINAVNFIQQIAGEQTADQIADLCLFLSELAEPNVLHTLYVDYHQYVQALNGQSENKPGSLFDKRFPELRPKACAANLGDPDCVDGKEVHLEKWFLDNFSEGLSEPSKLDSVSCTLRHEMAKLNDQKYFLPILLTYLKQTRPSVSTALLRIHRQSDKELRASSLNYLKYILEMHVLVKEALASYDLSAAKMVYAVSNLDPKEYLPLLARLEAYEPAEYRAYQIDMHLKRYDQALANLVLCRPFAERATEALELIEQKHLYQLAIGLFGAKSELCPYLNQIYSLYGDYLLVKKYFSEALIVYKKGENYVNAIKAAQLTNNWNQIIECASLAHKQQAKMAGEETEKAEKAINLTKIYQSVAEQLDNTRDAKNSSFIYAFYLNDWYQAVRVLIKNYRWADVFRLLNDESFLSGSPLSSASASTANSLNDSPKNGVDDPSSSISNPTDPASPTKQTIKLSTEQREELISLADQTLAKHYEEMVDYLNESLGELRKHTERLEKVRELKLALKEQMSRADDLNELEDEFLDSQSTISTVSSVHSGKRKSAKGSSNQSQTNSLTTNQAINKKKKDKKRKEQMYRLKPGSRDEDLALIYHIRQRIKSIEKQRSTVKLLIGCLAERGVDYKAVRLQIMFGKLLEVAQFVISVVWREADEQAAQNELSTSLIPGRFAFFTFKSLCASFVNLFNLFSSCYSRYQTSKSTQTKQRYRLEIHDSQP